MLSRNSPIPLYYQLATRLKDELATGDLKSGDKYYSDRQLVKLYDVSLLTARQAVGELVKESLVERRQGSGTYLTRKAGRLKNSHKSALQESVLFTGWSLAALSGWESMYFRDIYEGISQETNERNQLLIIDDPNLTSTEELLAEVESKNVTGVVAVVGEGVREKVQGILEKGLRVVTVNFEMPGVHAVMPDDYAGGVQAVEHLLSLGHRKLVHVNTGESERHWQDVERAYRDVLRRKRMPLRDNPLLKSRLPQGSIESGYECGQRLWKQFDRPTGIFAGNDLMAIGLLQFFRDRGISVPGEVSVVGFDNIEATEICSPPLTTISVDRIGLGRSAVKLLMDDKSSKGKAKRELSDVRLELRQSTGEAP